MEPTPEIPRSIRIGRILIRLLLVGGILYGGMRGWEAHLRTLRDEEIAPIHAYALSMLIALKNKNFFVAQEHLDPDLTRRVSIDWLAYFAKRASLASTETGQWNDWNRTGDANASLYRMSGTLIYTNTHTNPMSWVVSKKGNALTVQDVVIGGRSILPAVTSLGVAKR